MTAKQLCFITPKHPTRKTKTLTLMPQTNTKLERLLAQRTNRPLHLLGNLVDWRPGL
jgi:hypothetical protein